MLNALKLVGLISDTHIPARAKAIPRQVFDIFQHVELIVHAGDLTRISVVEELEQMAPVIGVHGNMDTRAVKEKFPAVNSFNVYDWYIGVAHSLNFFLGGSRLRKIVENRGYHVFVSGHTHRATLKYKNGALLINPGSPTNPIPPFLTKASVALLRIGRKEIEPRILHI